MSRGMTTRARSWTGRWAVAALAAVGLLATALVPAAADDTEDHEPVLHLVTLHGPGTSGHPQDRDRDDLSTRMLADQADLLETVGAPGTVYQWTTALNGFAAVLDPEQARTLLGDPRVAVVEEDEIRRLTARQSDATAVGSEAPPSGGPGGRGTVIGFVDSGIDPRHRAFNDADPLGPEPRFRGDCADDAADPTWRSTACGAKIVGAQYFVAGYGADNVRTGDSLSPRDTNGHGTQMAAIAAGSADVPVQIGAADREPHTGTASRARIASYKACWTAPDPDHDGCSTADVVAAIDRATADLVDVLNIATSGPNRIDTVERALLGATEADIVVVGAAGNDGTDRYTAHPSPWVTTVGATTGPVRTGSVRTEEGVFAGHMAADTTVTDAPLVHGADAAAPGVAAADARVCRSGSLDARIVADAVVICERGENARVAKSRAVRRADGVGMILVNTRADEPLHADLHAVPTVHLPARAGRQLARWAEDQEEPRVTVAYDGLRDQPVRVTDFSSIANPRLPLLKPDVVAPGTEILSAVPGGWDVTTGTSPAAARVSGIAAVMLSRRNADAALVRSALATTARPVPGDDGGAAGAGTARKAPRPAVSYLVSPGDYRAWLEGGQNELNQPHAVLSGRNDRVTRTLTNTSDRIIFVRATARGFEEPVRVFPSWAELAPGDTLTFTVTLAAPDAIDRGRVVWTTDTGQRSRLTVVATR